MAYPYLCEQMRALRKHRGLTQEQVAKALGIDRSSYTYYEIGKTEPSIESLLKIAKLFGVTVHDLLEESPPDKSLLQEAGARSEESVNDLTARTLTDQEMEWLRYFRAMNGRQKLAWLSVLQNTFQ